MDNVSREEYETHKSGCGESFDEIKAELALLKRAMFGDVKLEQKGVYEMTTEMYKATMYAKGGQKLFLVLVKVAGGIVTLWAAFKLFVENR